MTKKKTIIGLAQFGHDLLQHGHERAPKSTASSHNGTSPTTAYYAINIYRTLHANIAHGSRISTTSTWDVSASPNFTNFPGNASIATVEVASTDDRVCGQCCSLLSQSNSIGWRFIFLNIFHFFVKGSRLNDTLRLLMLWFDYGDRPEVYEQLRDSLKLIPSEVWLEVVPQLIARLVCFIVLINDGNNFS